MITIQNISVGFGELLVLANVSFAVEDGEFVAVVGPSGCGKTSLLRVIAGLLRPVSGHVDFDGLPAERARKRGAIGFCFQKPVLLPWRTVLENVRLPLELLRNGTLSVREPSEVIRAVRLTDFENAYPHQLSGGMQQRVALARALVTKPSILLGDEMFASIDELLRDELDIELYELARELHQTVIFVTHSLPEAVVLADRVVVLSHGPGRVLDIVKVEWEGARRDFRGSPLHNQTVSRIRSLLGHT